MHSKESDRHYYFQAIFKSMKEIVLTPVERGILIILMTQGKPVNQAGFKKAYGLDAKRNHRLKLENFGLIEVQGTRTFSYKLTKEGWAWLSQELTAPKPKGSMGLGSLYAALQATPDFSCFSSCAKLAPHECDRLGY
jgi:hypothetical protein